MLYERIFRAFQENQLQYAVIGGVAVNLHGYLRATADLDVIITLTDEEISKFIDVVKTLGMVPRLPVKLEDFAKKELREEWITEKNMKVFSVYNPKDPIEHIDVKIEGYEDFGKILKNSVIMKIKDIEVKVVDIDDLIWLKEEAGRDRDKDDVRALNKLKEINRAKK